MEDFIFNHWHIWIILGTLLFIVEIFLPGFVLACLGIGAIGAAISSLFIESIELELTVFSVLSIASFFLVRPFALKTLFKDDGFKSNADVLIGKKAEVTQAFNEKLQRGRVKIDGDDWRAETTARETLELGDVVEIVKVESNTLIVTKII
ncbi:MAG: NfeD family protein [Flavobacteriales bacterium]